MRQACIHVKVRDLGTDRPYAHLPGGHGKDSYCDETQGYGYHVPHGFPFPAFISFPQVVQVSFVTFYHTYIELSAK